MRGEDSKNRHYVRTLDPEEVEEFDRVGENAMIAKFDRSLVL
jgi:hypothetical protein